MSLLTRDLTEIDDVQGDELKFLDWSCLLDE
jgi:hypothetical protein